MDNKKVEVNVFFILAFLFLVISIFISEMSVSDKLFSLGILLALTGGITHILKTKKAEREFNHQMARRHLNLREGASNEPEVE